MGATAQRQEARRRAREARSSQEQERKAREKRLEDLAVTVQVEVDEAAERERRAGDALRAMTEEEGLSLREAVSWCGDLTLQAAMRLKRLATSEHAGKAGRFSGEPPKGETSLANEGGRTPRALSER